MSSPSSLDRSMSAALLRRQQISSFRSLTLAPQGSIDFSSNDFLSLSASASFRASFQRELSRIAHAPLGSGGSRLLDGNSVYAEDLEVDIAGFLQGKAGLLFNSGFDANSGFFACVPQPGDVVVYDELIHASVHEGMRLSRAGRTLPFAHNDVGALEAVLRELVDGDQLVRDGKRNVFVAVETLYSMDGDLAPLQGIVDTIERVFGGGNGYLIVDEAHSTGVYGDMGRGLVCELGLEEKVFARLHTFGKALACNGAIILCSPLVRQYLINYARTLIFTTSLSLPALAAVRAAFTLLWNGDTRDAQDRLHSSIKHLHNQLSRLTSTANCVLQNSDQNNTPIVSVLTPKPRLLAKYLQDRLYLVRPIVYPTVPRGKERVRICVHSANTHEEVDGLVARIGEWVEQEEKAAAVTDMKANL
ncbi:8-amino-7-oxononanoate synthase [Tricharina praecox]|uniref:8-amino-7-oxononanoate synthase n=1 Tax=Tricharina praecox TaxID=43433 RepID=UPI00221E79B6|nr:8-amino-7-oxononanoate synthase [Tricharina praecox]KAI5848005.1 8-amino-7-oxononanoate synthase [Tricharina praecox]